MSQLIRRNQVRRNKDVRSAGKWHGMNWIRQEKRLSIYLRDGLACAYCGASVEQGTRMTLDHVIPHSQGGTNRHTNLATSCHRCNSWRGDRTLETFAAAMAAAVNHGVTAQEITSHVRACLARPLDKAGAKALIARRDSAAKALASL